MKLAMFQRGAHVVRAPVADARVPKGLKPAVLGVTGLDTAPHVMRHGDLGPPPGFVNGRPCSLFYGQVLGDHQADFTTPLPKFKRRVPPVRALRLHAARVPQRLRRQRHAALTGKGATVAITTPSPRRRSASTPTTTPRRHGDPAFTQSSLTQSMPVEAVPQRRTCAAATAGSARRRSTSRPCTRWRPARTSCTTRAASCTDTDFLDSLQRIVDDNKASIVTNSWGDLGSRTPRAASSSPTSRSSSRARCRASAFMFSSGDDGDELAASGSRQTDYPAVRPVGDRRRRHRARRSAPAASSSGRPAGAPTSTTCPTNGKGWVPLAPPFLYGAGGGFSTLFNRPAYQDGVVHAAAPAAAPCPTSRWTRDPDDGHAGRRDADLPERHALRRVPDRRHEPRVAALRRRAGAGGQAAGGRLGFANPTIYALARAVPGAFNDVVHHAGGERPLRLRQRRSTPTTASSTASARSTRTRAW